MIPLDSKSRVPIYQQICEYLKAEIQRGRLRAGEKLPSARGLAQNLGISRSTVDLAYDQLVSEGYIEAVPCKGYYICDIDGMYFPKKPIRREEADDASRREQLAPPKTQEVFETDFALDGIAPGGFPRAPGFRGYGCIVYFAQGRAARCACGVGRAGAALCGSGQAPV